jgi:CRP/FNR family cyclic AMP-dependent transcriptional regulator
MGEKSQIFENFGRTLKAGEIICKEGDPGDTMYIIQEGKVRVTKNIGGKGYVLAILDKGDFFGEMALVSRIKRTATVISLTETRILEFDRSGFLDLIKKNASIALNIIDKLCRRLYNANLKLKHFVPRYEKGLVALSLYYAYKGQGKDLAEFTYNDLLDEISIDLDIPKQKVEEIVNEFVSADIVKIKGEKLAVTDQNKLFAITEQI